jgi:hypothetical protein
LKTKKKKKKKNCTKLGRFRAEKCGDEPDKMHAAGKGLDDVFAIGQAREAAACQGKVRPAREREALLRLGSFARGHLQASEQYKRVGGFLRRYISDMSLFDALAME